MSCLGSLSSESKRKKRVHSVTTDTPRRGRVWITGDVHMRTPPAFWFSSNEEPEKEGEKPAPSGLATSGRGSRVSRETP